MSIPQPLKRRDHILPTPPAVRDAITRLVLAADVLRDCGAITAEEASLADRGVMEPLWPNHWIVRPPVELCLEIAEGDEYIAEAQREFDARLAVYGVAADAYDELRPIIHAMRAFEWALGGEIKFNTKTVRALRDFRDALALFRNWSPGVKAYLLAVDQAIDSIVDRCCQILLKRLSRNELTAEQGDQTVALLKRAAEIGVWRDPEGDLERTKPQAIGFI